MIEAVGFCKAYDSTVAVDRLSFCVEPGQILGLVGPNGAGKTTTLRALTGIVPSSGGQLRIAGFDLDEQPLEVKRNVGYVPDDPQLFQDLTVEQHLAFTASVYGASDAPAKIDSLLERFDLSPKRLARASTLSRGMRQKLAICCAYLYNPCALLFDEPLTGLDPPGIRNLKQSMLERAAEGAAVIVSSHLLAMVEDICTHVLILNTGRQRFMGTLEQLRDTYAAAQDETSLEEIFFKVFDGTPPGGGPRDVATQSPTVVA